MSVPMVLISVPMSVPMVPMSGPVFPAFTPAAASDPAAAVATHRTVPGVTPVTPVTPVTAITTSTSALVPPSQSSPGGLMSPAPAELVGAAAALAGLAVLAFACVRGISRR
jgi:hypothetical protein